MKHVTRNKNQNGYSLIEVIICLFMIGVIFVLYASALNIVAITRKLRHENLAYHIANKQMEYLRGFGYEDLPASGVIADPMLAEIPSGAGNFSVDDYPGHSYMKEIVVTVTWTDPVSKQVVLKTLSGLGGINP